MQTVRTRPTARLVVIDDEQRILLFRIYDGSSHHLEYPDMTIYWLTPGGGLEMHETYEQAARRELWEETGIQVDAVGPCVWHSERLLRYPTGNVRLLERYFIVKVPRTNVSTMNMLAYEQETHLSYYWWSLQELETSGELFFPHDLPRLVQPLLAGEIPTDPVRLSIK